MEPKERPAAAEVKKMPLFRVVDWDNQLNVEPPFIPTPADIHDTGYFQGILTSFIWFNLRYDLGYHNKPLFGFVYYTI